MSKPKHTPTGRISTAGFVLMILAVVGVGLGLVMVVTTSIGAQSRELTALRQQADELEYESASLRTEIETVSSSASLALRASKLGMVPNPYPAFVMLGSGEVLGEPKKVTGREFPQLRGQTPEPPAATPKPEPVTTPTPVPPAPDAPADGEGREHNPEDAVAADQPGDQPTAQPTTQPDSEPTAQPETQPSAEPAPQPGASTENQPTEQPEGEG